MFTDNAKAKGHFVYRIILNSVILVKCIQYLENEKLREEIYRASLNVGVKEPYDNREIVNLILKILGYKIFIDMILKSIITKDISSHCIIIILI